VNKMKLQTITGKIDGIERLNNSYYGNPRFLVFIGDLVLTTKSDYSYVYNIENLYKKECLVDVTYYETKTSYRIQTIKEVK